MLQKKQEQRQTIAPLRTDMLPPKDHLLRKTDAAVDFKHICGRQKTGSAASVPRLPQNA